MSAIGSFFGGLFSKTGKWLKPLWKGAAKKLLASQFNRLQDQIKANIDDDRDASIVRINSLFDGLQKKLVDGLGAICLLPAGMRSMLQEKVQREGDKIQSNIVVMVKQRGPVAVDAAFDGLEARLDEMIESL